MRALLLGLVLTVGISRANDLIFQSSFQTSDWSKFTHEYGTLSLEMPAAVQVPAGGASRGDMEQFHAGQPNGPAFGDLEGGGIYQTLVAPQRATSIDVDPFRGITTTSNLFGRFSPVLIDFTPVANFDFGSIDAGEIRTTYIDNALVASAMQHTTGLQWYKTGSLAISNPYEFVSGFRPNSTSFRVPADFAVEGPEPSTIALFSLGLALLAWRGRSSLRRNMRPRTFQDQTGSGAGGFSGPA